MKWTIQQNKKKYFIVHWVNYTNECHKLWMNEPKYKCTKYECEPNTYECTNQSTKKMNYDYEHCIIHHSLYSVLNEWKIKWTKQTNEVLQWTSSFRWTRTNEFNSHNWTPSTIITRNTNYIKKALNKNCSELNFPQKTKWTHVPILLMSGANGLQRLPCLKHYNVLQWKSKFTLGFSAAESTDYIKKCFK